MVLRSSSISPFTICNASSRFIRMGKLWHTALATPRLLRRRSAKYSVTPNALTPSRCHPALSWREPCGFQYGARYLYLRTEQGIDTGFNYAEGIPPTAVAAPRGGWSTWSYHEGKLSTNILWLNHLYNFAVFEVRSASWLCGFRKMPLFKGHERPTYRIFFTLPTLPIRRAIGHPIRRLAARKESLVSVLHSSVQC